MLGPDGLLKSPLKLIGGKTGIKKNSARSRMYSMLPKNQDVYAEPFLGSGGVLMGKAPHGFEMVNDLNPWVINFFCMLRSFPLDVTERVNEYRKGMTRERFNELRFNEPDLHTDPVQAAAWYYVIDKWARNGIVRFRKDGKCNSSYCNEDGGRGLLTDEWLGRVLARIQNVRFYNMDYKEFLRLVDFWTDPDCKTIVVLDPPYDAVFTKYNGGDSFSAIDQAELAVILSKAKYNWLLTINDNEFVRRLYSWAHINDNPVHWQCSNTVKGRGVRNELIITNYKIK